MKNDEKYQSVFLPSPRQTLGKQPCKSPFNI